MRRGPPGYRLPYRLLVVYLAAIAALVWGFGCSATGNTLARWGGAAGGAAIGGALGGPLGAAGGAIAGDAGGDALVEDPPTNTYHNAPGGTIYTTQRSSSLFDYWEWIVVGVIVFRFRHGLLALLQNIMSGAFGAAGMTSLGILLGGKASEKAKAMTAAVGDRRRRNAGIPVVNVISTETKPHA